MTLKTKQIFPFALFILMLITSISFVSATTTYSSDSPYIKLLLEEVTPEPVEPGQDVTVKIRIINEGGETAEDVSVKLNYDFPFYLKTTSDDEEKTKNLCVGCSMDNTYYLTVDADAKSGLYPLTFEIYESDIIIKPTDTIDIKIVGKPDIVLYTNDLKTSVTSGETFDLELKLDNIGTGIARNIKIIPQSDNILMIGSNINLVDELFPESNASLTSEFMIKSTLAPDTYKFPMKLSYLDEQGNAYETTFEIGLNVLEKADVGIQSIKITPTNPTLADEVHMEGILENTGTGNAEKVTIELLTESGKNYKTFVGQLKADDDAPFYFDAKPETIGMQKATLKISYTDDFGSHVFETTLEKEVGKPANKIFSIIAVLVVIIGIVAYFVFKSKKNKK
ncbi:S-layer protein [Candidatus Woesearchaeota archaeon]|nr:S-layer protein [Candidatus Woesearchaeota archaeon]